MIRDAVAKSCVRSRRSGVLARKHLTTAYNPGNRVAFPVIALATRKMLRDFRDCLQKRKQNRKAYKMYKPNYKYAVFDMDGTLLDTMYLQRTSSIQYLRDHGLHELAEELKDSFLYTPIYKAMEAIQPLCVERGVQPPCKEDIMEIMQRAYQNPVHKPGALPFLELLKANGVRMCVMSATEHELVERALKNAGLDSFFEFILSSDEFPKGKTDTAIFEAALEKFGAKAEETAMFEDALYSIKRAKAVGMYIVAIEDAISVNEKERIQEMSDEYFVTYPV